LTQTALLLGGLFFLFPSIHRKARKEREEKKFLGDLSGLRGSKKFKE
jgi:hypothetical protein